MPSLSSLAESLGATVLGEKTSSVAIEEFDEKDESTKYSILRFQYFPESISDTKGVNWSPKEIPGGSLPLYQWTSSGERGISFQGVFTTDVDFSQEGVDTNADALFTALQSQGQGARNVDIRSAVLWLRRFMMPRYETSSTNVGTPLTRAPHKLRLHMPGTGIGTSHGGLSNGLHDDQDYITAIMLGCDVEWIQFFPSGMPRIATVSLSFAQIAQFNGMISFPAASEKWDDAVYKGSLSPKIFPYKLQSKGSKRG